MITRQITPVMRARTVVICPSDGVLVMVPGAVAPGAWPLTCVVVGGGTLAMFEHAANASTAKPEPYKGKGIRYENETVRRKEGKSFAAK